MTVRRYLDDAPSSAEIVAAHLALGNPPFLEMMRKGEPVFDELGLGKGSTDLKLIEAMATHPILIERPIAFKGQRAVIGRPPEAVKELL